MLLTPGELHDGSFHLGAILAGGRSRRFGSPKALALLDRVPLVERMAELLRRAGVRPVAIVAGDSPPMSHLLPCREDRVHARGPLGGILTAVDWASDLGLWGALCVGCDTPFLPPDLLRTITERGAAARGRIVAAESSAAGTLEPLCAWYPTSALPDLRMRLEMGVLSLAELLQALPPLRIPFEEVSRFGDPAKLFHNINTPLDGDRAAELQREAAPPPSHG